MTKSEHKKWKHNELASDLKQHLSKNTSQIVWTDMQLGPSGSPRPDLFVMQKSYTKFNPVAYEAKISRSDFRSDVTSGKWQSYFKFAKAVIFAVPAGLISRDELPDKAGLIVRHDTVWRMAKKPTLMHLDTLPHEAWVKLMIDGLDRAINLGRIEHYGEWAKEKVARKVLGDEIADMIRKGDNLSYLLELDNQEVERQKQDIRKKIERRRDFIHEQENAANKFFQELCEITGLPANSNKWDVKRALQQLRQDINADERVATLTSIIKNAEHQLKQARIEVDDNAVKQ